MTRVTDIAPLSGIAGRAMSGGTAAYHQALQSVQFCLVAPGNGFDTRLVDYMACGCIPVIIHAGLGVRVLQPYEPELDYEAFAVTLPFESIPELPAILERLPEDALRTKRERLREVHRMFLWDYLHGGAFEAVAEALLKRSREGTASPSRAGVAESSALPPGARCFCVGGACGSGSPREAGACTSVSGVRG